MVLASGWVSVDNGGHFFGLLGWCICGGFGIKGMAQWIPICFLLLEGGKDVKAVLRWDSMGIPGISV